MSRRSRLGLALLPFALLVIGAAWLQWPATPAPDVNFQLIDGRRLSMAELRGRPVLVNFWSTSCPSCIAEMPELVSLHRDFSAQGLTIIGIAMPYDPPNRVLEFVTARKLPYAVALDLDTSLVRAFGDVRLTPTHILIGPDGLVRERHTGPLEPARTRQQVARLLEES